MRITRTFLAAVARFGDLYGCQQRAEPASAEEEGRD